MKAVIVEILFDILVLGAVALVTAGSIHRASGEKSCGGHGSSQAMASPAKP